MKAHPSRRDFIKKASVTAGIVTAGSGMFENKQNPVHKEAGKSSREVWIGTVSQGAMRAPNSEAMVDKIANLISTMSYYKPDVICLPEAFPTENIEEQLTFSEKLAKSEYTLARMSKLAKEHNCYIICPVFLKKKDKAFNVAVVFDRKGNNIGEYVKAFLPIAELDMGLTPGPIEPVVFQTDFGKIGIQICYDIFWNAGWERLSELGAEIVFWPSAFAGGRRLNAKAWDNKYVVVSSTRNRSKICDVDGEEITATGIWEREFVCAPVNLEKVLVTTWPYTTSFNKIREKYGRKIKITTSHEEEWSVIESLSPDVSIKDVLQEFKIKSYQDDIRDAGIAQIEARKG